MLAEVLGVEESTVGRVVSDWRSYKDNTFTPHKTLRHPKLQPDENILEILRTKILDANKKAELLFIHSTLQQFFAEKEQDFSKWRFLWLLHKLGFYYSQRERRNILHELSNNPNNIAFHSCYLRFCFANLEGHNDISRRSEVFLDESYCHLHHNARNTWTPHHGVI